MTIEKYNDVMARKNEIMKKAVGIDYDRFRTEGIAFDYEQMMQEAGYSIEEIIKIQMSTSVGNTPLIELKNIGNLVRRISPKGKGARIFLKDEACNPSGSFKDRRASVSVFHAHKHGFPGVVAATSGNYGAAVASQAAKYNLKCMILQETFDSKGVGQPEILEKGRSCEALGAEVVQMTVGPELFYYFLVCLEETGFFNASLYTPFGISGIETLGMEIATEMKLRENRYPDVVLVTHAGGGNLTGTARGLRKAHADGTRVIGASVDLHGLHMASDVDFNRKSFTTGHTGFGIPFAVFPDRSDVPLNAARPLRYMDDYYLVTQGEVFYTTEMLAQLEGLQRGPAGNTSLCAAIGLARKMEKNQIIVVQETEYTSAGKCPSAQLSFALDHGIRVDCGDPSMDEPGNRIVIPERTEQIAPKKVDLTKLRASYVNQMVKSTGRVDFSHEEIRFMAEDIRCHSDEIKRLIQSIKNGSNDQ